MDAQLLIGGKLVTATSGQTIGGRPVRPASRRPIPDCGTPA
jgi:hypothetical protein